MKSPTKKELKIILVNLRNTKDVIEAITEYPYTKVMDKDEYLKKLFYALNDASLELGKMIDQKDVKENEVKAARAYRHNRICDCAGRGRRRLLQHGPVHSGQSGDGLRDDGKRVGVGKNKRMEVN